MAAVPYLISHHEIIQNMSNLSLGQNVERISPCSLTNDIVAVAKLDLKDL